MKTIIDFDTWWFNIDNQLKADVKYGDEASRICDKKDPNLKIENLYTDTIEYLARKNEMHLVSH